MKFYNVKFINQSGSLSGEYLFKSKMELKTGCRYKLKEYKNDILISGIKEGVNENALFFTVKEIKKAIRVKSELIKQTYFNLAKGVTVIVWTDGTKTKIICNGEKFDYEKAIALAFVKRFVTNNDSSYNDIIREAIKKSKNIG